MKYCPSCKADRDEADFYVEPKRPGGLSSTCKECKRALNRTGAKTWYSNNKAAHITNVLARRKKAGA